MITDFIVRHRHAFGAFVMGLIIGGVGGYWLAFRSYEKEVSAFIKSRQTSLEARSQKEREEFDRRWEVNRKRFEATRRKVIARSQKLKRSLGKKRTSDPRQTYEQQQRSSYEAHQRRVRGRRSREEKSS